MIDRPKPIKTLVYKVAPVPCVEAAAAEMMMPTAIKRAANRATAVSLAMNYDFLLNFLSLLILTVTKKAA